tara:strand:- start:740 stop:877 length:138 start_codon:yes stop_codon:yes gene_type:complete
MDNVTTYQDLLDMDHAALIEECTRLENERLEWYMLNGMPEGEELL